MEGAGDAQRCHIQNTQGLLGCIPGIKSGEGAYNPQDFNRSVNPESAGNQFNTFKFEIGPSFDEEN